MNNVRLDTLVNDADLVTPALVFDLNTVHYTLDRFRSAFPDGLITYAVKANPNPDVMRLVVESGGGLEIASTPELEMALQLGCAPERIVCSNPIKPVSFIRAMHAAGVYAMTVDSPFELEKIAQHAPGSRIYVRLAVDNSGAVLPLAGKFGCSGDEALELMDAARDRGLDPIGFMFHVGSQCLDASKWSKAIATTGALWRAAEARGHRLHYLDIGGGYPAGNYHDAGIPTIEAIAQGVYDAIRQHIPHPRPMLVMEPGRGLVGDAGMLIATVVGKAYRAGEAWVYLDAGVYHGMIESYMGLEPVMRLLTGDADERPLETTSLAGPTCDSCDVMARGAQMPELRIGDRVMFLDAGAYCRECAVAFNGFEVPSLIQIEAEPEALAISA